MLDGKIFVFARKRALNHDKYKTIACKKSNLRTNSMLKKISQTNAAE